MNKIVDVIVLNSPSTSECKKVIEITKKYRNSLHLVCGGLGECLEYIDHVEKVYGIPNLYDDDHIIKELKNRNTFVSGKWIIIDNICIAGIDSKNPIQSINKMLDQNPKDKCLLNIILSTYPMSISKCSKKVFKGKELSIGLPIGISRKIVENIKGMKIIISCTEYLPDYCIDKLSENIFYLSIPRSINLLLLRIDIENNRVFDVNILK